MDQDQILKLIRDEQAEILVLIRKCSRFLVKGDLGDDTLRDIGRLRAQLTVVRKLEYKIKTGAAL